MTEPEHTLLVVAMERMSKITVMRFKVSKTLYKNISFGTQERNVQNTYENCTLPGKDPQK